MRLTVRCPADGVVEVSLHDLEIVVVRSGSDVRATYRCPLCGSPIEVGAFLAPSLLAWIAARRTDDAPPEAGRPRRAGVCQGGVALRSSDEAFVEYFRRELSDVETVEDILAFMDNGERPRRRT